MGTACPQFTWNGSTWNILPGTALTKQPLANGGFSLNYDLRFVCALATFAAVQTDPVQLKNLLLNKPLVYLGDSYKIMAVNIHPGGASLVIEANALNQNA